MGAINFAGLRRLLDYQVTSVIRHRTISRIILDYTGKLQIKLITQCL